MSYIVKYQLQAVSDLKKLGIEHKAGQLQYSSLQSK